MIVVPSEIQQLCDQFAEITYENLSKILHYHQEDSAQAAQRADDSFCHDLDQWMGGGTCFSMTWHLYLKLKEMGFNPRLLMGHKRTQKNVHCALRLDLPSMASGVLISSLFLDPGYLIFDPLEAPLPGQRAFYPLVPNQVELRSLVTETSSSLLQLWTGSRAQNMRLRFEFPWEGVDESSFRAFWRESFSFDMMQYPVLNRLDRQQGIQYYYQKGNLVTRTAQGSEMRFLEPSERVAVLSQLFHLDRDLIHEAFNLLKH